MADPEQLDTAELAFLVKRLDRQRRARLAAESISEQATRALYDKQQHVALLQAIAVAANESSTFKDALQSAVDAICTQVKWPVGHVYMTVGRTDILALSDVWYLDDLARYEPLRAIIEETRIMSEGAAARAREGCAMIREGDLDAALDPAVVAVARKAGLRSVIAFPALLNNQPVAVLEFFTDEAIELDANLVDVLTSVGRLLGKIHERTQSEVTLRSSEEEYRLLFEGNPNPMWISSAESSSFLAVNDAFIAQTGYSREELMQMRVDDLVEAGEGSALFTVPQRNERQRMSIRKKDGRLVEVEVTARELRLPGHLARLFLAVDAGDGHRTEQELRESERRFRNLLDNVQMAAVLIDVVGHVTYCNPYLLALSGWEKGDVIGANWFDAFLPPERRDVASGAYYDNIRRGSIVAHEEAEIVTRRDERRSILWNNTVLRNSEGSVLGAASIGLDVTEQKRAEKQLLHDAFHDSLTGLPNRALFLDRAAQTLARFRRKPWHAVAVLVLDLDRFKDVNDTLGHAVGDRLLIILAKRLSRILRAGDTVARLSGGAFAVLIENIIDMNEATRTAERLQKEVATPFEIDGEEIFTGASIGITVAGPEYELPDQMVRDAEIAMYRAKAEGRGRYEIFDARMRADAITRIGVERDLRHALDRGELRVLYQPIVELRTRAVRGFEALVRWQHPTRGMMSPAQFIPIAEETGLIVELGAFVVDEACRYAARLSAASLGSLTVSVNISSRQFSEGSLVPLMQRLLDEHRVKGSQLHLEITESVLIQHADVALATMEELRALGLTFSIDDFGTGYSSLSYLHRFPIDQLKIDSSFVRGSTENRKNFEIIRSIIDLGRNLNIEVVAEGIETEEQLSQLVELGCGYGQGYLFARPLEADAAMAFKG